MRIPSYAGLALALLSLSGFLTLPASAQQTYVGTVFTEDFTGADGTLPYGWVKEGDANATAVIDNNQLLLSSEGASDWATVSARRDGYVQRPPGPGTLVRI